nr:MAG TPA: hypothetical protein [Caudoviricetes sp.]
MIVILHPMILKWTKICKKNKLVLVGGIFH